MARISGRWICSQSFFDWIGVSLGVFFAADVLTVDEVGVSADFEGAVILSLGGSSLSPGLDAATVAVPST